MRNYHLQLNRPTIRRAAIIGVWLLLSAMALAIACPPRWIGPGSMGAQASLHQVDTLDGKLTAIYIENSSDHHWGDILLKLDRTFTHAIPSMDSGSRAVILLHKFTNKEGRPPPSTFRPQTLMIRGESEEAEIDLKIP